MEVSSSQTTSTNLCKGKGADSRQHESLTEGEGHPCEALEVWMVERYRGDARRQGLDWTEIFVGKLRGFCLREATGE